MRRSLELAMASIMFFKKPLTRLNAVRAVDKIRSIIIVVDQIAIFIVAGKKVSHLPSPQSAHIVSYWSEDAPDSIGNRGDLLPSLIGAV